MARSTGEVNLPALTGGFLAPPLDWGYLARSRHAITANRPATNESALVDEAASYISAPFVICENNFPGQQQKRDLDGIVCTLP